MTPQTDPNGEALYLDDLRVGQQFGTAAHVISESDIKTFASQFDPQPFHLDDAAAKASVFGGLAASGWHTAAITMRLLVESGPRIAGGIIGMHGHISWLQPTRPGDVLTVESEVLEVTPSPGKSDRGHVTMRSNTRNQRGEVVQLMSFKLLAKRRHAPSTPGSAGRTGISGGLR
jgi:acyl dehydratase